MIKIRKHKTGQENSKMNLSTPKDVKKKSPNKKVKPSNRKLDGEKFLDSDKISTKGYRKPTSKKIDGEKFLSKDLEVKKFEQFVNENLSDSWKEKAKEYYNKFKDFFKDVKFTNEEMTQMLSQGSLRPIVPPKSVVDKMQKAYEPQSISESNLGVKIVKGVFMTPIIIGFILYCKIWMFGFHADVSVFDNDGNVTKSYKHVIVKAVGGRYVQVEDTNQKHRYPIALVDYSNIWW